LRGQKQERKLTRAEYDARVELLTDRLAICLMILKQRYGDDWNPWFGEALWESEDGMAEILRQSNEYPRAREVVQLFIHRSERDGLEKNRRRLQQGKGAEGLDRQTRQDQSNGLRA
jgi:hypothetical protein